VVPPNIPSNLASFLAVHGGQALRACLKTTQAEIKDELITNNFYKSGLRIYYEQITSPAPLRINEKVFLKFLSQIIIVFPAGNCEYFL